MNYIASAAALAISLTNLGAGHYSQISEPHDSAVPILVSASVTLGWTQCTATAGDHQYSIPAAKTEGECISLALKCTQGDDMQWTYHPYYVTTDGSFERCELTIS